MRNLLLFTALLLGSCSTLMTAGSAAGGAAIGSLAGPGGAAIGAAGGVVVLSFLKTKPQLRSLEIAQHPLYTRPRV